MLLLIVAVINIRYFFDFFLLHFECSWHSTKRNSKFELALKFFTHKFERDVRKSVDICALVTSLMRYNVSSVSECEWKSKRMGDNQSGMVSFYRD